MENENNKFDQLKDLIAPDIETRKATRKAINDYAYYVMIALVSLLVVFIPPLVYGSVTGDLQTAFPQTPLAWVLWGILNASTYVGAALSTYGFAALAEKFDWNFTILTWIAISFFGALVCFFGARIWQRHLDEYNF